MPPPHQAPAKRSRPLAPREQQRLHEALMGRSVKRLVQLVEDLAEEHPWLAEEVRGRPNWRAVTPTVTATVTPAVTPIVTPTVA